VQTIPAPPAQRSRYDVLSPDELTAALARLDGWHGDTRRIARTVAPADLWRLLELVAAVEADLDHHTVVDLDAGTVTFSLWTHVRDAVTWADIELAQRLDAVIAET
jgi:4a-hydroxytetrahydrobiopterin dehydratase